MKKTFIKSLCLTCSVILILTSCNIANYINENNFNIKEEEYLIRFTMVGPMLYKKYMFVLTPDNKILAEYVDENQKPHKFQTELNELQSGGMNQYIEEVLTLKEEDITRFIGISDFWYCTINFNDVSANFDYGASNSTAVNILLEQIIGCCDAEKTFKTVENLQPIPTLLRKHNSVNIK